MSPDRIVVGVDGSEGSLEALRWAVDEARRRDVPVEVVCAWHQPFVAPTHILGDVKLFADAVLESLDAAIATVDITGVAVERQLVTGNAAYGLIRASKGAALLVVGSRGRGGVTGMVLGSVSQQVAHHSHCPVVIVPTPASVPRTTDR